MKQYDAADKFWEVLQQKPQEFNVIYIYERSYVAYRIEHISSKVAVQMQLLNGQAKYDGENRSDTINYAAASTTNNLMTYAMERIEQEKIQKLIDTDNLLIDNLLQNSF